RSRRLELCRPGLARPGGPGAKTALARRDLRRFLFASARLRPLTGLDQCRLRRVLAQVRDDALRAIGLAGLAYVAAVQDQPMMRVLLELVGRRPVQRVLDVARRLARREVRAVRDAKDVRVDGDRRLAERRVQDHVRRLASDARQLLERFAVARDLAAVLRDERLAGSDQIPRLRIEEIQAIDIALQAFLAEREHLLWRVRDLE